MLYRKLGKSGFNVSILGFGAMRLPILGGSQGPADRFDPNKLVDEERTIKMIEYAIGQGVNYFDTAYVYHGGKSEPTLGKALKRYRNKVMLATKLPVMRATKREDFDRFLDEQLKRLDTNYLDVYLLHGLNRQNWVKMKELGVLKFLDQIQADGRTRYVGFSFHDDVRIFKEIVDSYDWMLCQIQYNYYDEHYQAGRGRIDLCSIKRAWGCGDGTTSRWKIDGSNPRRDSGHLGFRGSKENTGRMGPEVGVESS